MDFMVKPEKNHRNLVSHMFKEQEFFDIPVACN